MSGWTRRAATGAFLASGLVTLSARAQALTGSPPLWVARGAKGSAVLRGQMPPRKGTPWQSGQVMAAFEASGKLWLENPEFTREEVEAVVAAGQSKLRLTTAEFLPAGDLDRLHAQIAQAGAPEHTFDNVPADDLFSLLGDIADRKSGADFSRLPERVFRQAAAIDGKPIVTEWQSLAEVAAFIPSAPDPLRLQLIRLGLDDVDFANQSTEHLDAWVSGDVAYFDRLGAIIAHRHPDLAAKMSGERNLRLAERLAVALADPGQHFVCVGIRHVTGPASIQTFLAQLGIDIQRA